MYAYVTDVDCSAVASRRPGVIRLHDGLLDARAPSLAGFERLPGDSMGAMQNG